MQRGQDGPARHLRHVRDTEGDVSARLAPRRINKPNRFRVNEQTDRNTGLAQQPLEASLRRRLPLSRLFFRIFVEVLVAGEFLTEQQPGRLTFGRLDFADREGGPQRLSVFSETR